VSESARIDGALAFAEVRFHADSRGFTLIELLVAVMIFAMLSLAGVVLLRGSVTAQVAVSNRLDGLADVQRGIATLEADLAQATVRITRTQAGKLAPAFFGRGAQSELPVLQFVRGGWSNPGDQPRPSVQKVEYWWRDGRIERIGYAVPDGAAPGPAGALFEQVTALRLRYRGRDGAWVDEWAPSNPQAMPALVELELTRTGSAPLVLRFLVGTLGKQVGGPAQPGEGGQGASPEPEGPRGNPAVTGG
jgi:general secretion pathway protein J